MNKEIDNITIIPAKFAGNMDDNHRMFDCYIDDDEDGNPIISKRKFEEYSTENINNPTYVFIGILSGPGYIQVKFVDAKDYEDLFIEKWGCLVLTTDSSNQ